MGTPTDEQLFVRYRQNDCAALEELIYRYEAPLFAYLMRHLADAHMAEDVFQETFLKVARSAADYDPSRPFRPWLYTIAGNLARDCLRKRKVRKAVPLKEMIEAAVPLSCWRHMPDFLQNRAQPAAAVEQQEEEAVLQEAILDLPPDFQDVVRMHFFEGLKYQEMADSLEIPLGTVKSRLHSAVQRLSSFWHQRFGLQKKEPQPCTSQTAT